MKFIIIGQQGTGKHEVCRKLNEMGVKVAKLFSTLPKTYPSIYHSGDYERYSMADINELFENGSYIFMHEITSSETDQGAHRFFEGLTHFELDNSDVVIMSPDQVLAMQAPQVHLPICFVWMDGTKQYRQRRHRSEKREYSFAERERIENQDLNEFSKCVYTFETAGGRVPVIYFNQEEPARVATIIAALVKHPDLQESFIKNFN